MTTMNPYTAPNSNLDGDQWQSTYEPASRWRRLIAALIDAVLDITAMVLLVYVLTRFFSNIFQEIRATSAPLIIVGFVVRTIVFLLINGYLLAERGQTIGKLICSTRIVCVDGSEPSLWHLFLRRYLPVWLLASVPVVGFVLQILEVMFIFRSSKKCLHDELANTVVVNVARDRA